MPLEVKRILRYSPLSRQFDADMKIKFRPALMGTSRGLREPNTYGHPLPYTGAGVGSASVGCKRWRLYKAKYCFKPLTATLGVS